MTSGLLLTFFMLVLLLVGALLASALSNDPGFVMVVWHDHQILTSVGIGLVICLLLAVAMVFLFIVFSTILFGSSYFYQRRKAYTRRKTLMSMDASIRQRLVNNYPASFAAMEVSLTKNSLNLRPFNKKKGSALHLLQADVARLAGLYPAAMDHLTQIDSDDHELATLVRAQVCIDSGDLAQAQNLLDLLLVYPERGMLEPVRESLQPHFDLQVGSLWTRLACLQPWKMLSSHLLPQQKNIDWDGWLRALTHSELPEDADDRVKRLQLMMPSEIQAEHASFVFPLLVRVAAYISAHELAQRVLAERLDLSLLDQWMSLCVVQPIELPIPSIEALLQSLEQRFPAQPDVVLVRVRWMRHQHAQSAIPYSESQLLEQLKPYAQHPLVQHYQLIWQVENAGLAADLREAILQQLSISR
jgi:uncharacterized protein HemY